MMTKKTKFLCSTLILSAALVGCSNLLERIGDEENVDGEHEATMEREPCDVRLGTSDDPESRSGVAVVCPAH